MGTNCASSTAVSEAWSDEGFFGLDLAIIGRLVALLFLLGQPISKYPSRMNRRWL